MENSNDNNSIPEMNIENKYSEEKSKIPENSTQAQKEMEKTKKELEKLKNFIVKKYPFTQAIGIFPPQSIKVIYRRGRDVPKRNLKNKFIFILLFLMIN